MVKIQQRRFAGKTGYKSSKDAVKHWLLFISQLCLSRSLGISVSLHNVIPENLGQLLLHCLKLQKELAGNWWQLEPRLLLASGFHSDTRPPRQLVCTKSGLSSLWKPYLRDSAADA